MSATDMAELQLLHRTISAKEATLKQIQIQQRQALPSIEALLVRFFSLERFVRHTGSDFTAETLYTSKAIKRPYSMAQIRTIDELGVMLRENPLHVAEAVLAFEGTSLEGSEDSLSTLDLVLEALVFHIFRHSRHTKALLVFAEALIQQSYAKLRANAASSQSPSDMTAVLRPNSAVALFLKHFLDRFGSDYLQKAVQPSICVVLQNEDLELDLNNASVDEKDGTGAALHHNLIDVCRRCLIDITSNAPSISEPIRHIASILYRLPKHASEANVSIISDFFFLHWIVNAFWNPRWMANSFPITNACRSNLEAVGTVLLKLISGSNFSPYEESMVTVNDFLQEWTSKMNAFLSSLILTDTVEQHYCEPIDEAWEWDPFVLFPQHVGALVHVMQHTWPNQSRIAPLIAKLDMKHDSSLLCVCINPGTIPPPDLKLLRDRPSHATHAAFVGALSAAPYLWRHREDRKASELLQREIERAHPAQAALLMEALHLLESVEPSKFIKECRQELQLDLDTVQHMVQDDSLTKILIKENAIQVHRQRFLDEEILLQKQLGHTLTRRLLSSLSPRLHYFRSQLRLRMHRLSKYECSGFTYHTNDIVICRRCHVVTDKQSKALQVALQDCVRALAESEDMGDTDAFLHAVSGFISKKQLESLQPTHAASEARIYQYLVTCNFPSLFSVCHREEARFTSKMRTLQQRFQHYAEFQRYLDRDGSDRQQDRLRKLYISENALSIALVQLCRVETCTSLESLLNCFDVCHEVLIALLSTCKDASADDYIPLLCYAIMQANPSSLLSAVGFIKMMQEEEAHPKPFLDVLMALKYLSQIRLPSDESMRRCTAALLSYGFESDLVDQVMGHVDFSRLEEEDALRAANAYCKNLSKLLSMTLNSTSALEALIITKNDIDTALRLLVAVDKSKK